MSAHAISPLWPSTTWNSWMSASPGAAVHSMRSVSPRVPTSEYARRKRSAAKLSQAASNSRLCASRSAAGRRRHAGSTFRNVNLTTLRFMARTPIYAARLVALGLAALGVSAARDPRRRLRRARAPRSCSGPARSRSRSRPHSSASRRPRGSTRFGFMSSIQGSYTPEQTFLDMSAGARTTTSLYDDDVPTDLRLRRRTGDLVAGTQIAEPCAASRARRRRPRAAGVDRPGCGAAPSHIRGPARSRNREAAVAADRTGRVERVALVATGSVGEAALRAVAGQRPARREAAARAAGRRAAARGARRAPRAGPRARDPGPEPHHAAAGRDGRRRAPRDGTTLYSGLHAHRGHRQLHGHRADRRWSASASTFPTTCRASRSRRAATRRPPDLSELRNRLTDLGPRRWAVIWLGLIGALLHRRRSPARYAATARLPGRALLLAAMWLPSVLLLTAAIAPSAPVEGLIVAGGCALLALATDRIRPWYRALAVPAAVAVALHVADLALGSDLVQRSLLGPEPRARARASSARATSSRSRSRRSACWGSAARLRPRPPAHAVWGFALGGGAARVHARVGAAGRRRGRGADGDRRRDGRGARRGGQHRVAHAHRDPARRAGRGARRARPARPRHGRGRPLQPLGARGRAAWTRSRTSRSGACGSATDRSGAGRSPSWSRSP